MAKRRDGPQYASQAFRSLADQFSRLEIFGRPRPVAVYNYIAASDLDALRSHAMDPNTGLSVSHRRMVESSAHVIPYMYRNCADVSILGPLLREETGLEGKAAYDFGSSLESITYAYELADRGQFRIFVASRDPRISFAYAKADADHADSRVRASEVLSIKAPAGNASPEMDDLIDELRPRVVATKRERCDYEYSDRLIQLASEYGLQKLTRTNRLQLPEDLAIGDLTVRDLHLFWAALMAISDVHTIAHWIADDGLLNDLPINTMVIIYLTRG